MPCTISESEWWNKWTKKFARAKPNEPFCKESQILNHPNYTKRKQNSSNRKNLWSWGDLRCFTHKRTESRPLVTPCPFDPFDPFGPLDPFAQGRMGQVGGSSVSSGRFKWVKLANWGASVRQVGGSSGSSGRLKWAVQVGQVGQMGQMKHAFFNAICLRLITTSLFDHVLLLNAVSLFHCDASF